MIKTLAQIEIKKGDRSYQFILSNDSPLGECFDVLSDMRAIVYQKIVEAQQAEDKKEEAV